LEESIKNMAVIEAFLVLLNPVMGALIPVCESYARHLNRTNEHMKAKTYRRRVHDQFFPMRAGLGSFNFSRLGKLAMSSLRREWVGASASDGTSAPIIVDSQD